MKSRNDQTTCLSGVISRICGCSGPAWQLTRIVLPFGRRSTCVTQASTHAGQVVLANLPDDVFGGGHLQNAVAVARADERVAVVEPHRGIDLVAEGLRAVAGPLLVSKERHVELPDDPASGVVLANHAVLLMGNEIRAGGGRAGVSRVGVGRRRLHRQRNLAGDHAGRIDLDDPRGARFDDHRGAVGESLERVHLDGPVSVAVALCIVLPDGPTVGVEFYDLRPAVLIEQVTIGEEMEIVDRAAGDFPFDAAVGADRGERVGGRVGGDHTSRRACLHGRWRSLATGHCRQ